MPGLSAPEELVFFGILAVTMIWPAIKKHQLELRRPRRHTCPNCGRNIPRNGRCGCTRNATRKE